METKEYVDYQTNVQTLSMIKRIEWVDIFKAICIILMVLGHAYGGFNSVIYQFHMAAFFFISGYTSGIWKHDLESSVLKKIHVLIVPMFVMIVILSFVYHIIDSQGFYDSITMLWQDLINFIITGSCVNLLGAIWFILVLFFCYFIHRIGFAYLSKFKHSLLLYFIFTIITFLFGYYLRQSGYYNIHYFDVVLVAELYFGIGVCVRLIKKPQIEMSKIGLLFLALFCVVIMIVLGNSGFQVVMDMATRIYPSQIVMLTVPFIGIIATYCFSVLIESSLHYVKELMILIGKETIGILFFNFTGFKVATIILMIAGITTVNDLKAFLLPTQLQGVWWAVILYVVVSIAFSVIVWKAMCSIPYFRILLGKDNGDDK